MILFPAIDIKDGNVVRLQQGKFDDVTEYSGDPLVIAKKWQEKGAQWLHLVDLDGAQNGNFSNINNILQIVDTLDIPVQMGGGLRREEDVDRVLEGGLSRAILGTKAVEDRPFLAKLLSKYGDKIAVSLDCKDGFVTQRGWAEVSDVKGVDLAVELEQMGVKCIIYTDVARDGMLTGPNYDGLEEVLNAVSISVIASGGIASIEDIKKLCAYEKKGLLGAITGKAIYEGKLNITEALELCSQNE